MSSWLKAGDAMTVPLRFDFEDGVQPPLFSEGQVVSGPPRVGNAHSLIATVPPHQGKQYIVRVGEAPSAGRLLSFSTTKVLRFDYWAPDEGPALSVSVVNRSKGRSYSMRLAEPTRGTWAHAEVPLRDLGRTVVPPMDDGDSLGNLSISGGQVGGMPFYVDNLEIVDVTDDGPR
jgi:hypothetical protein